MITNILHTHIQINNPINNNFLMFFHFFFYFHVIASVYIARYKMEIYHQLYTLCLCICGLYGHCYHIACIYGVSKTTNDNKKKSRAFSYIYLLYHHNNRSSGTLLSAYLAKWISFVIQFIYAICIWLIFISIYM